MDEHDKAIDHALLAEKNKDYLRVEKYKDMKVN
jgi:hypothetical protein